MGYTREIVFSNTEECDARRFINLALSQGSLQTMLRMEPEIVKLCVSRFEKKVHEIFEDEIFPMDFCLPNAHRDEDDRAEEEQNSVID